MTLRASIVLGPVQVCSQCSYVQLQIGTLNQVCVLALHVATIGYSLLLCRCVPAHTYVL